MLGRLAGEAFCEAMAVVAWPVGPASYHGPVPRAKSIQPVTGHQASLGPDPSGKCRAGLGIEALGGLGLCPVLVRPSSAPLFQFPCYPSFIFLVYKMGLKVKLTLVTMRTEVKHSALCCWP